MIAKAGIYDEGLFGAVELRPETKDLLKIRSLEKGEETIRLNRLLLEDTYPLELSRDRQSDKEVKELQGKAPARRVTLVGSNAKNAHDITEPLQWLMR